MIAHKNPKGIIVLDETDKIIAPDYDSHSCNRSEKIQGQLMALLSPGVPLGNGRNTNQYMYIMTGAFSNLRSNRKHVEKEIGFGKNITPRREQKDDELTIEALKEYGMMPEFARRVTGIFTIKALSRDSLYDIAMLQTSMFMSRTRRVKDIYGIEVDIETMSKLAIDEAFQVSGSEEGLFNRAYSIFDREVNKIVLERFKG